MGIVGRIQAVIDTVTCSRYVQPRSVLLCERERWCPLAPVGIGRFLPPASRPNIPPLALSSLVPARPATLRTQRRALLSSRAPAFLQTI